MHPFLSRLSPFRSKLPAICIPMLAVLALSVPTAQAAVSPECLSQTPASGTYTGAWSGGAVWGNHASGYTTDSDMGLAVVHAGLLKPGASAELIITPMGKVAGFIGSMANGITSLSYGAWCGMKLALAGNTPDISVQYSVPMPLIIGQEFTVRWSAKNATSLTRECTAERGGFQSILQDMALPSGSVGNTVQASWAGKPSTCVWTATGPGGTRSYTEVRTTKMPDVIPPPVYDPSKPPTLEAGVTPNPFQPGQPFTLRWKVGNAVRLHLSCTANKDGFSRESLIYGPEEGTSSPIYGEQEGSIVVEASEKWVGNPSNCTWTATGPGGSKRITEIWETRFSGPAPTLQVQYSSPMPLQAEKPFTLSWQSTNATSVTRECRASYGGFVSALRDMPSLSGSLENVAAKEWIDHPSTCTWKASGPGGIKTIVEVRTTSAAPAAPVEEITFFHNDAAGTAMLASDAKGNIIWRENSLPYGVKQNQSKAVGSSVGYTGKPFDDDTGLSYMNARYYDPVLGRFLAMDPVEFMESNVHSFNRYAYANNNPYRFVDPTGKTPLDIFFLMADGAKLGLALYSGVGVGPAAMDFGASAVGLWSPVPGTGQFLKGMRAAESVAHGIKGAETLAKGGTYVMKNLEGKVMRSGRTNNLARRELEHSRDPKLDGLKFEVRHHTDVRSEQRGLEQMLHDQYNPLLNAIKPINPANPRRQEYMEAAQNFLRM